MYSWVCVGVCVWSGKGREGGREGEKEMRTEREREREREKKKKGRWLLINDQGKRPKPTSLSQVT